jgi:hypothetical protein
MLWVCGRSGGAMWVGQVGKLWGRDFCLILYHFVSFRSWVGDW